LFDECLAIISTRNDHNNWITNNDVRLDQYGRTGYTQTLHNAVSMTSDYFTQHTTKYTTYNKKFRKKTNQKLNYKS